MDPAAEEQLVAKALLLSGAGGPAASAAAALLPDAQSLQVWTPPPCTCTIRPRYKHTRK